MVADAIPKRERGNAWLGKTCQSAQADTGTQLQKRFLSPWTLSTRATDGQYLPRRSAGMGNTAVSRD